MPYYLDTYIGDGSHRNEYRPSAADEDPLADFIDMRPGGLGTGFAIVRSNGLSTTGKSNRIKLADDKLTVSKGLVTAIQNRLGLNMSQPVMNFTDVLTELFVVHSRKDKTRWNPLTPVLKLDPDGNAAGVKYYEIWLGDLVKSFPVIAGGATYKDAFTRSNSTTLGNGWTEPVGDWEILSNQLHLVTNGGAVGLYARWGLDVNSSDMYSQVKVAASANYSEYYVLARYDPSAQTFYFFATFNDGTVPAPPRNIRKSIAGGESRISSTDLVTTHANGDICKIECIGSTIKSYKNGSVVNTVTDTSIPSGVYGGLGGYVSGTSLLFDDIEVGDVRKGRANYRSGGSFVYALKPFMYKSGGVFVTKPMFVKVGGAWIETP